jgi:transposase
MIVAWLFLGGKPMPSRIMSWEVSDDLWERVEALLPVEMARTKVKRGERWRGGRPPANRRKTFAGIVYVLRTGCQWKAVPRKYGNGSSIHRYFQKWAKAGVFSQMWLAGLAEYDEMEGIEWKWQSIDGAMVKAPLGGEASGPNPTDRGKKRNEAAPSGRRAWRPAVAGRQRRKSQ